jgi:hypothetical protein
MVPNGTCGKLKLYLKQAKTSAKQGKKVPKGGSALGRDAVKDEKVSILFHPAA